MLTSSRCRTATTLLAAHERELGQGSVDLGRRGIGPVENLQVESGVSVRQKPFYGLVVGLIDQVALLAVEEVDL